MQIVVSHNFPQVQARLDQLQRDIAQKATVRAVNRTVEQANTQMRRAIGEEFNLTSSKIREKLFIRRARYSQGVFGIQAELLSKAPGGRRSINLRSFGAVQTRSGLAVRIKRRGARVIFGKGFIANKGRTAFERVGKERLPIRALQTIDVPQMFNARRIKGKVRQFMLDKFPELWLREVAYYTRTWKAR